MIKRYHIYGYRVAHTEERTLSIGRVVCKDIDKIKVFIMAGK